MSLVFICRASQPSQHQGPSAVSACVLCMMLPRHVPLSAELTRGKANVQSPRTSHPLIGGDRQHSQAGWRVLLPREGVTATQSTGKRWTGGSHKESRLPNAQVLPLSSSGRQLLGRACRSPIREPSSEQDHMGSILPPNTHLHFVSRLSDSLPLSLSLLSLHPPPSPLLWHSSFSLFFSPSPFYLPHLGRLACTPMHTHRHTHIPMPASTGVSGALKQL